MKRWRKLLRERDERSEEAFDFYGPVAVALGLLIIMGTIPMSVGGILSELMFLVNLIVGIVVVGLGLVISCLVRNRQKLFARLGISVGLSVFSVASRLVPLYGSGVRGILGWVLMGMGIAFMVLGIVKARKLGL